MPKSATKIAQKLLAGDEDGLEELRLYLFEDLEDDEVAQDETAMEGLYAEFAAAFDSTQAELSRAFGEPSRAGREDDEFDAGFAWCPTRPAIPLSRQC